MVEEGLMAEGGQCVTCLSWMCRDNLYVFDGRPLQPLLERASPPAFG